MFIFRDQVGLWICLGVSKAWLTRGAFFWDYSGYSYKGMIFRSFRKRNSSEKDTTTVYSGYSYSGIVPKERALGNIVSSYLRCSLS